LRNGSFRNLVLAKNWITDLDDLPTEGKLHFAKDGGSGQDWKKALPAYIVPLNRPIRIHVPYEVPGFGNISVIADNESNGYVLEHQSDFIELNLNYEIAKSKFSAFQKDYQRIISEGYAISPSIHEKVNNAETYLQEAEALLSKSSHDMKEIIDLINQSLREAFYGHEVLLLDKARADIERYRKGKIKLQVIDMNGRPVPGVLVSYKQSSHDFLFGANPMGYLSQFDDKYALVLKEAGINYSYILCSWASLEPSPGVYEFGVIDEYQNITRQIEYGFNLMGGLALWFSDVGDASFMPLYQIDMSLDELKDNIYNHMRALVSRYKDWIKDWEITEQNLPFANMVGLTWEEKLETYRVFINGTKSVDPEAKFIFSSLALPYEQGLGRLGDVNQYAGGICFPDFLDLIINKGIQVDTIGLEFYYSGKNTDGYIPPTLELSQINNLLEKYQKYSKPLLVREFSAPSVQVDGTGWWHHEWDEQTQAEYLRDFYTLAFSKRLVKGISWSFGVSDKDAYIIGGGLLREDFTPKPSYHTLKNLITSIWTTTGQGITDENGQVSFSGFAGDYEIRVEYADGVRNYKAHAYKQRDLTYRILPNSIKVEPTLDIKANASDGPITVYPSGMLSICASVKANGRSDKADWWLAVSTPVGLFFYTFEGWRTDESPMYQGKLFDTGDFEVLSIPFDAVPLGTYSFYFGVDDHMDGKISWNSLYYDVVTVKVEEK